METRKFTVYTESHQFEVGDDVFLLRPEADPDMLLDSWATLKAVQDQLPKDGDELPPKEEAERRKAMNQANREYLADLMEDESKALFLSKSFSNRIVNEMTVAALEVYGLRPTTSSSDSSEPSATTPEPGTDSTGSSPSEE